MLEGRRRAFRKALKRIWLNVLYVADVLVPKSDLVVLRTVPDFDDQGREFVRAWRQVHPEVPIVWLVSGDPDAVPPSVAALGVRCRSASSVGALWCYLRANLVVHTKGLYGIPKRSSAKCFVNLWHGMPVKRLYNNPIGQRQTDLLTVTSPVHGRNFIATWGVPEERVIVQGLPRCDRMVRAASEPLPDVLAAEAQGRRLCLWLPTFRNASSTREHRDGRDFGNVFQLPGASAEGVAEIFAAQGLHVLAKPHPIAGKQPAVSMPGLTIWNDDDLMARDLTLYEALGHAELLLTDHSSVWIDYLLLGRPIVFTIADWTEYAAGRGHYFTPLEDHLPGPRVDSLEGLRSLLATPFDDLVRSWGPALAESRNLHHRYVDDHSAERIVATVTSQWRRTSADPVEDRGLPAEQL